MDIKECLSRKSVAEHEIMMTLRSLAEETGLVVKGLDLTTVEMIASPSNIASVTISLSLPLW